MMCFQLSPSVTPRRCFFTSSAARSLLGAALAIMLSLTACKKERPNPQDSPLHRASVPSQTPPAGDPTPSSRPPSSNSAAPPSAASEGHKTEESADAHAGNARSSDAQAVTFPEPTPETLARGRAAFERAKCVNCHGQDGASGRAPNLTDVEWLHCDGGLPGILQVLKTGVPKEKLKDPNRRFGMNPATQLVPDEEELKALVVYVHSLSHH